MEECNDRERKPRAETEADRRARSPYRAPVLRVFGPVALLTNAASMAGALKDGGPNNLKT